MRFKTFIYTIQYNLRTFWYNYVFVLGVILFTLLLNLIQPTTPIQAIILLVFATLLILAKFSKNQIYIKYLLATLSFILLMMIIFTSPMSFDFYVKIVTPIYLLFLFVLTDFVTPLIIAGVLLIKLFSYSGELPADAIAGNTKSIVAQSMTYNIISYLIRRIIKEKNKYHRISITDSLTKLLTLSHIIEIGNKLLKIKHEVTILVFDLNNFKLFNDKYGYLAGNNILIQLADYLSDKATKLKGWVGRLGGDEFILLLKDYNDIHLDSLITELTKELNEKLISFDTNIKTVNLTFSIGKSSSHFLSRPLNLEKLLYNADIDMYYNKFRNKIQNDRLKSNHDVIPNDLKPILNVLAEKDIYTYIHSEYTALYAAAIAKHLNMPENDVQEIYKAGWLHDIGKILISKNLLVKSDKLEPHEYELVKEHVYYGQNFIDSHFVSDIITNGILYHHEQWNGNGYPKQLKGEKIPIEARILKIADSFSAMIIKRVYSSLYNNIQALEEIKKHAGSIFDPELVKIFETIITKNLNNNHSNDTFTTLALTEHLN